MPLPLARARAATRATDPLRPPLVVIMVLAWSRPAVSGVIRALHTGYPKRAMTSVRASCPNEKNCPKRSGLQHERGLRVPVRS